MRPAPRLALAAATALAVLVPLSGSALAAPVAKPRGPHGQHGPTLPSEEQVAAAKKDVDAKQAKVDAIEASLQTAKARVMEAVTRAEVASERYNGAMWRLTEAQKKTQAAREASAKAAQDVEAQRSGIVTLVTDSYQDGTALNTATALMSDEGPDGLMNRYAVVQSAGDSMEARYDRFRATLAIAKVSAHKAAKAEKRQTAMAEEAHQLAVEAGQAVAETAVLTNQIAAQKRELVTALADAQDKSSTLAQQRKDGLAQIAAEKAAALAEARRKQLEKAQQAALAKAAAEAKKKAAAAKAPDTRGSDGSDRTDDVHVVVPIPEPPLVVNPAPNNAVAVQRAIAFAQSQLGKPYLWAASGPSAFDCSGLTMRAWAAGGKTLPHYSVAQYSQSRPISMADLKPGDLLFWTNNGSPSGIHHVALYVGSGQYIEAPFTGSYVRYSTLAKGKPDYAARP